MRKLLFVIPLVMLGAGSTALRDQEVCSRRSGPGQHEGAGPLDAARRDAGADQEERGADRGSGPEGRRGRQVRHAPPELG